MKTLRAWTIVAGIAVGTMAVVVPPLAFRWWQERGEWFPMAVGDRWTYRDLWGPAPVVFEVLRKTPDGAFVVERRIGTDRTTFVLSITPDSVFLHEASGVRFDPPFEEFRLPHAGGPSWSYDGRLGDHRVSVESCRQIVGRRRFRVQESSSLSGLTRFTLERGKGVVELSGKRTDPHGAGNRRFEWTLEKFERGG